MQNLLHGIQSIMTAPLESSFEKLLVLLVQSEVEFVTVGGIPREYSFFSSLSRSENSFFGVNEFDSAKINVVERKGSSRCKCVERNGVMRYQMKPMSVR